MEDCNPKQQVLKYMGNLWDWVCSIFALVKTVFSTKRLTRPNFDTSILALFYMMKSTTSHTVQIRITSNEIKESNMEQTAITQDIECTPASLYLRERLPDESELLAHKGRYALATNGQVTRGKSTMRSIFDAFAESIRVLVLNDINDRKIDQYTRRTRLVAWFKKLKTIERIYDRKPNDDGFMDFVISKVAHCGINH
jgi:hypothetical protein